MARKRIRVEYFAVDCALCRQPVSPYPAPLAQLKAQGVSRGIRTQLDVLVCQDCYSDRERGGLCDHCGELKSWKQIVTQAGDRLLCQSCFTNMGPEEFSQWLKK